MKYNFLAVVINITQGCNLRCKYCQVAKNPKVMTKETLKKALDWVLKNVEVPFVNFFGGEPLTEWELIKWAIETYYPKIRFGFSTNVTLLTPERIKFCYEHDVQALFSIDGIGEVHNQTRDNSWNLIKDKLPVLGELYSNATFRMTITPTNVSHLVETIYIASQLGFKKFNALPDGIDENWTPHHFAILKQQLTILYNDKMYRERFNPFIEYEYRLKHPDDTMQCCDGKSQIAITTEGKFSLCGEQTENDLFIVGDLDHGIDTKKVERFWEQFKPCPIHCKANLICSKERCFSRRYYCKNDISERIKVHCRWYNIIEELIHGDNNRSN